MSLRGTPRRPLPAAFLRQIRPGGSAPPPPDPIIALAPLCWYRAEDLALADGAAVPSWPDRSGNGHAAGAVGVPTYLAAAIGGKPGVLFGGSAAAVASPAIAGPALTVAAVSRRVGFVAGAGMVSIAPAGGLDYSGFAGFVVFEPNAATVQPYRAGPILTAPHPGDGVPFLSSIRFDGATCRAQIGAAVGTAPSAGSFGADRLVLGGRYVNVPSNFAHGQLCESILWDRALSDAELATVHSTLAARYGL